MDEPTAIKCPSKVGFKTFEGYFFAIPIAWIKRFL